MSWVAGGTHAAATTPSGRPFTRQNGKKTDTQIMSTPLTKLANKLRHIHFPDETGFFDTTFFDRVKANGPKACYPLPGGRLWVVKFSLGGKVCVLGFTDHAADAARFADMARVRFHRYKLRGSWKPLTDHELNFDLNQVKEDETEVPEALALLEDIEHLLLSDGVLEDYKAVEAKREAIVKTNKAKQNRNTRGGEIIERLTRIEALLAQFVALNKTT